MEWTGTRPVEFRAPERAKSTRWGWLWAWLPRISLATALTCITARILVYPLQHDEQFYLPASILFRFQDLYPGIGFSHLPNLPILLHGVFALAPHGPYLLVGRIVIIAAWFATIAALILAGRRYANSGLLTALMVALLVCNPGLTDATGMAVTNNFIATPFALFGLLALLEALERPGGSARQAALAGFLLAIAMGFKANYVVLALPVIAAVLLLPRSAPLHRRLRRTALPLAAGALIGAAPTLLFLAADPMGFLAHVFHFHRGPQIAYWDAHGDPFDPKILSMPAKLALAARLWLGGTNLMLVLALAAVSPLAWPRRRRDATLADGAALMLAGIVVVTALASFLPTPAFPQYYTAPIPFAVLLLALLHGRLDAPSRDAARPWLIAALGVAVVLGAPALLSTLPRAASISAWTGVRVHADGRRIAQLVRANGRGTMVVTLSPVHVLEGGLTIDPSLALGPFVYRAADWIPAEDRRHYRFLASPTTIEAQLDHQVPAAVLVGAEGALDAPLLRYALRHGFEMHSVDLPGAGFEAPLLLTRPRLAPSPGRSPAASPGFADLQGPQLPGPHRPR
ncbi:4-amino-4-deoxy-L-arabinose transferase [Sphingomonas sp. NFR04]|uniref:hypothetical protein n=1 Tax=Sphingomonas sp. NFR04 TaxID=1566283 RepID=UPI0008EA80B3|nr:hypothetical protein [Sphingomonas sp. NFR04]SFJ04109.1 4-amino-4-deoxy-L-arabinose transferase [Sphingomonas sp. NFR04]